jgi:hypothetical protein
MVSSIDSLLINFPFAFYYVVLAGAALCICDTTSDYYYIILYYILNVAPHENKTRFMWTNFIATSKTRKICMCSEV